MDIQRSLIQELMLSEIELTHNIAEATKNICWMISEGAVDHSTVNKWFKKFCTGWKNSDNQAKSGRPKTVDSEADLQAIEQIRWVALGEYQASPASHNSVELVTFTTSAKAFREA